MDPARFALASAASALPELTARSVSAIAAASGGSAEDLLHPAGEVAVLAVIDDDVVVAGAELVFEVRGAAGGRAGGGVPVAAEVEAAVGAELGG